MFGQFIIFTILIAAVCAGTVRNFTTFETAQACKAESCVLPNCRCLSTEIPNGLDVNSIPQLVLLTFDDAVNTVNFKYYEEAFFNRKNPDGCSIGATYYISHEYTDYSKVQELHARGHEIALHSISHETMTTYWDDLSLDGYKDEFGGERTLIAKFADIPEEDIKGLRVPFLQLPGDTSFQAIKDLGLKYDSSWPTLRYQDPPLFPYTLDYLSNQDCPVGKCPTVSLPGVWVQPMVDWTGSDGNVCAMVDSCATPDNAPELLELMKSNFQRHYTSNKAPFGFYIHAAWFDKNPVNFEAYKQFLDYLGTLNDVYIVTVQRGIEWVQNPTTTKDLKNLWPSCPNTYEPTCEATVCTLNKGEEVRYMTQCSDCPDVYPWLGNPLGIL
ncbi:chitin deacetylase 7-like [Onthophagus taurus]|uniref:chitin deacetylase 7-like n=1 Tax=Onthophagus taurus TaxID=166361 RepID=UPI0039BDDBC7